MLSRVDFMPRESMRGTPWNGEVHNQSSTGARTRRHLNTNRPPNLQRLPLPNPGKTVYMRGFTRGYSLGGSLP